MGSFSSLLPYADPGSLQGGRRSHQVLLQNLQSDVFRSAAQSQITGQSARAFSGANVTNEQTQTATIEQDADANNTKMVTIAAVTGTNEHFASFNSNYLQSYIAGAGAADFLAGAALNVAQEQGSDQGAVAVLENFDGDNSTASNVLAQTGRVTQDVDVDIDANLSANVSATTVAAAEENAFNQSRFRTIEATTEDQTAQAIFTVGQSQGSTLTPGAQLALADGATAGNTLTQVATVDHNTVANMVDLRASFDLSRNETGPLAPRPTQLLSSMLNDLAINSSAASQEQILNQQGAGGISVDGVTTENGGTASNVGSSSAMNREETDVTSSISITI